MFIRTRLYNSWRGAKERCTNPNHKNYHLYKDRWHIPWSDFKVFKEWALSSGYTEGLTIDRINSDIGYSPENCQWLTAKENTIKGNKERKVTQVYYKGKIYTKTQLASHLGLNLTTLSWRLKNGSALEMRVSRLNGLRARGLIN